MSLRRNTALSLLACALLAGVVGMAFTFSAFTATTENDGNKFKAGTVVLSDNNASGTALIDAQGLKPGDVAEKCLTVSYDGTLPSKVRLYGAQTSVSGVSLAEYLDATIERGTLPADATGTDCTDFVSDGDAPVFTGELKDLKADYATGHADPIEWNEGDKHVYRIRTVLQDADAAQGLDATTALTFEARNVEDN